MNIQEEEGENVQVEQPNLLQQEGQAQEHQNDEDRIPQQLLHEAPNNDAQLLQGPQEADFNQRTHASAARQVAASNLSNGIAQLRSNSSRSHHDREESLSMRRRHNDNAVERTSGPERHNMIDAIEDDDSQAPTPASWSTVPTYGGTPPSERSRTLTR